MSYGLTETSRNLDLSGIFSDHPHPPIVFGATVHFPFAGTFEEGILLAYDATNQRYAPYHATTAGIDIPEAVLLVPVTVSSAGSQTAKVGRGIAYFDRLKQGQSSSVLNQAQTTTTLPSHRIQLGMSRGLYVITRQ